MMLASVLDRLLDDAPQAAQEPPYGARFDLARHKQAVARDLEALLNTRCPLLDPGTAARHPLASCSFLAYGIPDLSSLSLLNPDHRRRLRDQILQAVVRFEPRLCQVRVDLEPPGEGRRLLRFRVEAVLRAHPARPGVVFAAVLKLSSNACQVRG